MRNPLLIILSLLLLPSIAYAYDVDIAHAPLAKVSIDLYDKCFPASTIYRSREAQARLIQGDRGMDTGKRDMLGKLSLSKEERAELKATSAFNLTERIGNWHFYNPDRTAYSRIGLVEQSQARLWEELKAGLSARRGTNSLLFLGGLMHLTEDVSVPAHSIPVYHGPTAVSGLGPVHFRPLVTYMRKAGRTHGGMIKDPIDNMPPNIPSLIEVLSPTPAFCSEVENSTKTPEDVRNDVARAIYGKLEETIPGCAGVSWKAFWIPPAGNEYFGRYDTTQPDFGKAGTVRSKDGRTCEMREGDERYAAFVQGLHIEAIKADLKLLRWHESHAAPVGRQE